MAKTTQTLIPQAAAIDVCGCSLSKIEKGYNGSTTPIAAASLTHMLNPTAKVIAPEWGPIRATPDDQCGFGTRITQASPVLDKYEFKWSPKFRMNAENAAWLLALALGKVTTAALQTDKGYVHTIEPFVGSDAPATGTGGYELLPSTALYFLLTDPVAYAAGEIIAKGIYINSITVTAKPGAFAEIDVEFIGSGETADGSSVSTLTIPTVNQLWLAKFEMGTADSEVDMTLAIEEVSWKWSNDVQEDAARAGGFSGYRTQALRGDYKYELSFKLKESLNQEIMSLWAANTVQKAILTFEGAAIASTSPTVYNSAIINCYAGTLQSPKVDVTGPYKNIAPTWVPKADGSDNYCDVTVNVGTGGPATLLVQES